MLEHFQTGISANKKKLTKTLLASVLSLSIVACSTQPERNADISSNITLSASLYLQYAKESEDQKIAWEILAARALVANEEYPRAQALLNHLKVQNLSQLEMTQVQLAQARLYYQQDNIESAEKELDKIILVNIEVKQAAQYLELKALLGEYESRYVYAAKQRLKRDSYLNDNEKQENWQKVWDDLSILQAQNYADALSDTPILNEWLALIQLHKSLDYRKAKLQDAQRRWLSAHPSHPANIYPSQQMRDIEALSVQQPKRIALLLPLSGNASDLGDAVRDGFMAQMFDNNTNIELYIHNTKTDPMEMLYQDIQKEKADMIVGPLLKSSVQKLIIANDAQLPVLSLNIPQNMQIDTSNTCFYSLSPEQEAEQTAVHIFEAGKKHPVIFSTKKSVNKRMAEAFVAKWAELTNGSVVDIREFSDVVELQREIPKAFDKRTIEKLEASLNLAENRKKKLAKSEIKKAVEEAKRASESLPDAVYLLGQQSDLILMKPFIEVAANPAITDVEFYTSSHSYQKSGEKYAELNGLVFSVMPMFVGTIDNPTPMTDSRVERYNTQLSRLYAMGKDAYTISQNLMNFKTGDDYTLNGLTGTLSAGEQCVIQREMTWVRYKENGIEVILPTPEAEEESEGDKQDTNIQAE